MGVTILLTKDDEKEIIDWTVTPIEEDIFNQLRERGIIEEE